jgi:hypothetical protein
MKLIALALFLAAGIASADPLPASSIANMMAQSEDVMSRGLCAVANDQADYKGETVVLVLPAPIGVRRVLRNDYNWVRNAGYAKAPSGLFLMTERIKEACSGDALIGRCLAVRSLWNANWRAP